MSFSLKRSWRDDSIPFFYSQNHESLLHYKHSEQMIQRRAMMSIFTCSKCKYTFERKMRPERCPDCGADTIRNATDKEKKEYILLQKEFYPERFVS